MSMILVLRRAGEEVLAALATADDDRIAAFLSPEDENDPALSDGSTVDLDTAWHAIHFLLTRQPWNATMPNGFLLGGREIGEDIGYGPARILSSTEVKAAAAMLSALPDDFVRAGFDFDALQKADVYPTMWDRKDPADIDYTADYFELLRTFMATAAAANEGIAIAMM